MNIFKRHRNRHADQLSDGRADRRRAPSHSRDAVLADPMTAVALRSLR